MASGPGFVSYSADNDKKFRQALSGAALLVRDLRPPLRLIANDFYRSQKAIWKLSGPGQYPDLADSTKSYKRALGIPIYPILKQTGLLEDAASNPAGRGAINRIEGTDTLVLGVDSGVVPYAEDHQEGIGVPIRKFFFIGPEAPRFANSDQSGRLNRWTNILRSYVLEVVNPLGRVA